MLFKVKSEINHPLLYSSTKRIINY